MIVPEVTSHYGAFTGLQLHRAHAVTPCGVALDIEEQTMYSSVAQMEHSAIQKTTGPAWSGAGIEFQYPGSAHNYIATAAMYGYKQQRGFSAIELLVAMTLGLVLLLGMTTLFVSSRASADLNETLANLQESARFTLNAIIQDSRQAGFQGCIDINTTAAQIRASNPPSNNLFDSVITGSVIVAEDQWIPAPPPTHVMPAGDIAPVPGTHALMVQFADSEGADVSVQMLNESDPVSILATDAAGINWNPIKDELVMVSNCSFGDVFRISSVNNSGGFLELAHAAASNQNDATLSGTYGQVSTGSSVVRRFHSRIYYVGNTGQVNEANEPVRALYLHSAPWDRNAPLELVQGVENLRLSFGVRLADGSLRFVLPNSPLFDASRVETLKIGVLMASWASVADVEDKKSYILAGQTIGPTTAEDGSADNATSHSVDRTLRQAFNTTVKIRNRRQ